MARLLAYLALVALSWLHTPAQASIPATGTCQTFGAYCYQYASQAAGTNWFPSADAACAAHYANSTASGKASYQLIANTSQGEYQCRVLNSAGAALAALNPLPIRGATQSYSCPANSTLAGSVCNCNSGFSQTGNQCLASCENKNGQTLASGYFDYGTNAGGMPAMESCFSGCLGVVGYLDAPAGSSLVDGIKHWYARGEYVGTGTTCTGSPAATAQTSIPEPKCAANQYAGTVNGEFRCVNQSNGNTTAATPMSPASAAQAAQQSTGQQSQASTSTTTTSTGSDGGTVEKTVETNSLGGQRTTTVTVAPDGTRQVTVVVSGPQLGNTPGESGSEEEGPDCSRNPNDPICIGGDVPIGDLYDGGDRTIGDVLADHKAAFQSSPIGSMVTNFFTVGSGGECPITEWAVPYIGVTITFDVMCSSFALNALAIMKVVLLLVASFFAFRVAME